MSKLLWAIIIIIGILIISFISFIFFSPSTQITKGGNLALDVINYEELCGGDDFMGDTCFEAVALYNKDSALCDKINEIEQKENCKNTLNTGKFLYREYTTSKTGCSFDSGPFYEACEKGCKDKNMIFKIDDRKTLEDPLKPSSVDGYQSCEGLNMTAFMVCYCY